MKNDKKASIKKAVSFLVVCGLCFLFSGFALAKMSDEEARAFLESLAEPSKEKKVFYRWQSEQIKKNLLKAGEMTPQLYEHFMGKTNDLWAGAGLYVAEDMLSSANYGTDIIQVELEPGYRYLNLLDEKVKEKLKSAGLSINDVYRLNPRVAVTDIKTGDPYWVLKGQEGVRFKEVSLREMSLKDLYKFYSKSKIERLIREEVLRRAKKDLFSVVGSEFIDMGFLREKYSESSIRVAVSNRISSLNSLNEIHDLFSFGNQYIGVEERKELLRKAVSLLKDFEDAIGLIVAVNLPAVELAERKLVVNKILELDEKQGLKILPIVFSSAGAEEMKIEFNNKTKTRVNCLKRQFSEL